MVLKYGGGLMGCNCKLVEGILALLVIIFTYFQMTYSKWIVIIAGLALLAHALKCTKHKK